MEGNSQEMAPVDLHLEVVAGEDADAVELDSLARQLLTEVSEQDIESADLISDPDAPKGTKSIGAVAIGKLAISVLPDAIPKLIDFLKAWSLRGQGRKVKIKTQTFEIEVSGNMSADEITNLVTTVAQSSN